MENYEAMVELQEVEVPQEIGHTPDMVGISLMR